MLSADHFCELDKDDNVIRLSDYTFKNLRIKHIICFETDINIVERHLKSQDNRFMICSC